MTVCVECGTRVYRTSKLRPLHTCAACQRTLCGRHAHYYIDDSNRAITASARPKCFDCYDRPPGVLGCDNLLLSGDYIHRVAARSRMRANP